MPNILTNRHLLTLVGFACSQVLLGFDYDGTLAPIARLPEQVCMRAQTRSMMQRVARCYPCGVLSGRRWDDMPGVRVIGGAQAINLTPRGRANKGAVFQRVRRLFACDTAIYMGDDDTDEDVFTFAGSGRLLGIRIGPGVESALSSQKPSRHRRVPAEAPGLPDDWVRSTWSFLNVGGSGASRWAAPASFRTKYSPNGMAGDRRERYRRGVLVTQESES